MPPAIFLHPYYAHLGKVANMVFHCFCGFIQYIGDLLSGTRISLDKIHYLLLHRREMREDIRTNRVVESKSPKRFRDNNTILDQPLKMISQSSFCHFQLSHNLAEMLSGVLYDVVEYGAPVLV